MATVIRPELSIKNKYWINKHRHYELKHFCLQYPFWKSEYALLSAPKTTNVITEYSESTFPGDPTGEQAIKKAYYSEKIKLVEKTAKDADEFLYSYILRAVTEELSFTYLKTQLDMPCSRDMYYDRYRRFFWLLSKARA